jgi:hypothetical protein
MLKKQSFKLISIVFILLMADNSSSMASERTEKQQYRVVHTEKNFEIRHYPEATLATVYSTAGSYRKIAYSGFRKLAGFIFGGNETNTSIAMTSPVHMDINPSKSSMSFVLPSAYHGKTIPKPRDPDVVVQQTKDEYVAAIRFGGYASDRDIRKYSEKLKGLLDEHGIAYTGNSRYLGYNPPYQVFGRKNEVIITIAWPGGEQDQ